MLNMVGVDLNKVEEFLSEIGKKCKKIAKQGHRVYVYKWNSRTNLFWTCFRAVFKTLLILIVIYAFLYLVNSLRDFIGILPYAMLGLLYFAVEDTYNNDVKLETQNCKPIFEEATNRVIKRNKFSKEIIDRAFMKIYTAQYTSKTPWRGVGFKTSDIKSKEVIELDLVGFFIGFSTPKGCYGLSIDDSFIGFVIPNARAGFGIIKRPKT